MGVLMKILHLIGGGDAGGAKSHVLSLVKELGKHMNVSLISFRPGSFAQDAALMGIDIRVVNTGNILSDVKRVLSMIRTEQFDLVHSHGAKANMIAVMIKWFVNIPVISTVHSDYRLDYLDSLLKHYSFGLINIAALRNIRYFVAVSNNFKEMLIERNFNPENIFTVYNGLDFSIDIPTYSREEFCKKYAIPIAKDTMLVGILARLHPVKGLRTFLKSAQSTLQKHPNVHFLIGGDGDEQKSLEEYAKEMNISDNVHFLGFVKDPYAFMNSLDINVLTSVSESFPYAILEGAKLKKPTISSDVGGISDLILHKINGYLFTAGDFHKLTEYICELIENPKLRQSFGQKIYEDAKRRFSLKNMCKSQMEIYHRVVQKYPRDCEHSKSYDIIVSGYYGHDNLGDDAMLASIIKSLRVFNENIKILVLSHNPINTKKTHSVNSIERMNILKLVHALIRGKLFINGGGNLIQDNTSTRSLLYYLTTIWLAKIFKMKVMLYSNGIGPLKRPFSMKLSSFILNKVDQITLRETISAEVLEQIKVIKPKISMTADPALALNVEINQHAEAILQSIGVEDASNVVAFSVRDYNSPANFRKEIAAIADYMCEQYKIVPIFVAMHYPGDIDISMEIISMMKHKAYIIRQKLDLSTVLGILSKTQMIIGMRLHALVFGVNLDVPIVGLSYEPKVKGFMEYVDIPYSIDIDNLNFTDLKRIVDSAWPQKEALRQKLAQINKRFHAKAMENAKIAIDLLNIK